MVEPEEMEWIESAYVMCLIAGFGIICAGLSAAQLVSRLHVKSLMF
jgi:hypothetical protein